MVTWCVTTHTTTWASCNFSSSYLLHRCLKYHKRKDGNWRKGGNRHWKRLDNRWGTVFSSGSLLFSFKLTRTSFISLPFLWTQVLGPVDSAFHIVLLLHHPRKNSISHWNAQENQDGNPCRWQLMPSPSHYRNVPHCHNLSATMADLTFQCTSPQWTTLWATMWYYLYTSIIFLTVGTAAHLVSPSYLSHLFIIFSPLEMKISKLPALTIRLY